MSRSFLCHVTKAEVACCICKQSTFHKGMKLFGLSRYCTFVFDCKRIDSIFYFPRPRLRTRLINNTEFSSLNFSTCTVLTGSKRRSTSSRSRLTAGKTAREMAAANLKEQYFDYFLVLDFEATCMKDERIRPQEIIEFPVLKINSKTLKIESTFHQYVQPRVHKELTPFCTELTGIIQSMVDGQPHIEDVLKSFDKWMADNNLLDDNVKSLFVTCGDWDLMKMLPQQAAHFKLDTPGYFNEWLNIKKAYAEVTSVYPKGMMPMLQGLNITHQGRHHSGIDDCKNIGNILIELLKRGYVAKVTGSRSQQTHDVGTTVYRRVPTLE